MGAFTGIEKTTFKFLSSLAQNNNREWFLNHKNEYTIAQENCIQFADHVLNLLKQTDNIANENGKKSLQRIYRDIRFSKDKTPYKRYFGGGFKRASAHLRGGYYFHIEPGNTFAAGGFWGPNAADLKRVRMHIAADDMPLKEVIESENFKENFGVLIGEQLKTAPKGYDTDHPSIALLRYKQFLVKKHFSDSEVLDPAFYQTLSKSFNAMLPFFTVMSELLTTDQNGISIIED